MTEATGPASPTLHWDWGTAYEFFVSLHVLQSPDMYGLRPSWAAGVRSRIPAAERKFLEEVLPFFGIPLAWIHSLPQPKDAISVLWALRQIPAAERISTVTRVNAWDSPEGKALARIAANRAWSQEDFEALSGFQRKMAGSRGKDTLKHYLDWWARPEEFGEALLSALQAYHQAFFEEEEKRVAPILQAGLERAQALARQMSVPDLIAELSQGVHLEETDFRELIVAPAYWTTPLVIFDHLDKERVLFLFGARPADMSTIPGEIVPEALIRTLKALADPTRLKILHYLSRETLTPSDLARKLRLRAPTVTHHLSDLRLSGLVHMKLKGQEKHYTARLEALEATCEQLKGFLKNSPD